MGKTLILAHWPKTSKTQLITEVGEWHEEIASEEG